MIAIILTGTSKGLGRAILNKILSITSKEFFIISISKTDISKNYSNLTNFFHFNIDLSENFDSELSKIHDIILKLKITELIFISNAGVIEPISMVGKLDKNLLQKNISINLIAPITITNAILSWGGIKKILILNISSGASKKPIAGWSCYCASKAAAAMFFECLRMECQNKNAIIEIENIDPGVMDTDMQASIRNVTSDDFPDVNKFIEYAKSNRLKKPDEAAEEIVKKYIL
ncbi:MAG: SDR family NAD(P)-dependent oxidoreductase [Raineya sp.]|nr:SDR family NAD(P)-dependent oxidoreductase [Raineya sp.]